MEIDTDRLQNKADILQKLDIDYKFTNRLQKTTKVRHRLQSLLIGYKILQKSDIDYKGWRKTTKVSTVCFLSLQRFVVSTF